MNTGALWIGPTGETFYAYDGDLGLNSDLTQDTPPANELWEFTPDGAFGTWSQVPMPLSSNFSNLIRTTNGIYGTGNGLGFALGGYVDQFTVLDADTSFEVAGMVMYNATSQQWYNISSKGYSYDSGFTMGKGLFVPDFGPEGLFFVLGGFAGDARASFDYAYMFEPISQQWKFQEVSGDVPAGVTRPCVAGVSSGNGTYEVCIV